jgi:hypothetical protein
MSCWLKARRWPQLEIGGDARASGDCVMPARLIKLISRAKARFWSEPYRPQGCLINRERDRAQECDIRVESGLVCWTTIGTLASITAEYGVSQEQVPVPLDPLKRRCFVRRAGRPIR